MTEPKIIILSLLSTVMFGVIDASFFLLSEATVEQKFAKIQGFDDNMAGVCAGGVAAAIAVGITSVIKQNIEKNYVIMEHPGLDVLGIFIGTIMVVGVYYILKKRRKEHKESTNVSSLG